LFNNKGDGITAYRQEQVSQSVLDGWVEEGGQVTDLLVPAEFNHEIFPLASTSLDPEEKLLTYTVRTMLPDGRYIQRTLEVEGSPRLGLPGLFDQEVYAGVMALAERKGGMPLDGRVRFSLYELKEILHLPTSGENYRKLRESLLRWQRTSLTTQGAIYLADSEEYAQGQAYNIWALQWANDSRPGRAKTELNEVKFHEYFIRNYQSGYLKSIDWDFWLSLGRGIRGGTLKRLYRLIDAERNGTLQWRTTVQSLMRQMPVPPSYKYPGKAKRYLERHHADLVERGFLESVEFSNGYGILYKVNPRFVSRQKTLGLADDPHDRAAIERLISFRMRESTARSLVALRGADLCQRYMDALPYQKDVRRKAGWLKTYIEGNENGPFPPKDGWAPPAQPPIIELDAAPNDQGVHQESSGAPDTGTAAPTSLSDPLAQQAWVQTLESLQEELSSPSLKTWFEGTVPTALDGRTLTLTVPNDLAREYIEKRFREPIECALSEVLGGPAGLRVAVAAP
jgi:hypothetical protein